MRIPRLYIDIPLADQQTLDLPADSAHYLTRVLRLGTGQALKLFNGQGGYYEATITTAHKKQVQVQLISYIGDDNESPLQTHLGIALSKGDRMDWVVQKATELGVTRITPLTSERSEVKIPAERQAKRIAHWQQIAISACEQCQRNRIPVVSPIQSLEQWLPQSDEDIKLVLHHRASAALSEKAPTSVTLLIGPEGGLSEQEITQAEEHGFTSLRMGPRVLRTETAPVAALALLQSWWGDI